ncbi:glycosyltransferase [Sulfitobacter sp. F26204]|uniref:glycosyltransferase family 2 protein n=1 Tax=Sulfitobacter sp. F26204 TaxID=2996014 RepID=UPI00225E19EA|nr:glycosyltransferase [Sulfitobacter sp. F26204]MCX7559220.1 glycosyltransferase [Sulfitobacter sp. F26204]
MSVAAVVIGRNEGERLVACLEALQGQVGQIVYVDSGSTDGSLTVAQSLGAKVISLDMTLPFTAARARNAGVSALGDEVGFVQLLDGDCVLRAGWIETATAFLDATPEAAVACGRRRERHPEHSIYNALIDEEWDTPVGMTKACGGDALMRLAALRAVGGYHEGLIAGEEPELCLRLRQAGWQVWRLDAEMTWHDAALTQFGQWWRRCRRAGHAFAEGAYLHGASPEKHWVAETRRALLWGAALPLFILAASIGVTGWMMLGLFVYPLQIARLARRRSLKWAFFTTLAKFPEAHGALQFYVTCLRGGEARIIEYK